MLAGKKARQSKSLVSNRTLLILLDIYQETQITPLIRLHRIPRFTSGRLCIKLPDKALASHIDTTKVHIIFRHIIDDPSISFATIDAIELRIYVSS